MDKKALKENVAAAGQVPKKDGKRRGVQLIRMNIRLSQNLKNDLERAAELRDMNPSEYIRAALRDAIERDLSR